MAEHFDNVKVVHADRREGLIRTRLLGAKHATGDVLLFLDSHVEANINYLPPLLGKAENLYMSHIMRKPVFEVVQPGKS